MIDSDDVLLLKPLGSAPALSVRDRAPPGATGDGPGGAVVGVHRLTGPDDPLPDRFRAGFAPRLAAHGLKPVAAFVTEDSPNSFPRLPVREGERVLTWLSLAADPDQADAALASARADPAVAPLLAAPLQLLRLQPTARSRLHG